MVELTERLVRVRLHRRYGELGRRLWSEALRERAHSPARRVWVELTLAVDGLARDQERVLDPKYA